MHNRKAIVIGAGIVGLAAARALAIQGFKVDVFEKSGKAVGASIRNFGMVWPISQPLGNLYDRAIKSRDIWMEICNEANIWYSARGSIHLAYQQDEMDIIEEFVDLNCDSRKVRLLNNSSALSMSQAINPSGLMGGFYSGDEVIVNAREAIHSIPDFFTEKYGITFHFNSPVTEVYYPRIKSDSNYFYADVIYVCSGSDFEYLFPEYYSNSGLNKCKLQMLKTVAQGNDYTMGPALCGGLTLLQYSAFKSCSSISQLLERTIKEQSEYLENGIHVMACQNNLTEVIIGDSHEYGLTPDPFNRDKINRLIIAYLKKFLLLPDWKIEETWNGYYAKMAMATELVLYPQQGVTIVNGLGGAGMTLSFGLLEELVNRI